MTGAEYFDHIRARESDRRAREAFQRLALSLLPAGAALFDFGSGPGIDARFYAEHGHAVAAYDIDPQMCGFFAHYCRDLIASGQVRLEGGEYREFLARDAGTPGAYALVTANFAPLSLIEDLPGLFAKFHALTAADGRVLASVLNPYFLGDCRYGWWWRNAPRLLRDGHYGVPGRQGPILRRRLGDFAAQGAPYFSLARVYRGLPEPHPSGVDVARGGRAAWLHLLGCRFMFLLFEKGSAARACGRTAAAQARNATPRSVSSA